MGVFFFTKMGKSGGGGVFEGRGLHVYRMFQDPPAHSCFQSIQYNNTKRSLCKHITGGSLSLHGIG